MSRLSALARALALIAFTAVTPVNAFALGGHGFGGYGWAGHGFGSHGFGGHGFGGRGLGSHAWSGHFGGRYGHTGIFRRPILSGYPYAQPYYYGNSGYDPGCVWVRRLVQTQYGPQWRVTPACAYGD
jgi:hypothetical protein